MSSASTLSLSAPSEPAVAADVPSLKSVMPEVLEIVLPLACRVKVPVFRLAVIRTRNSTPSKPSMSSGVPFCVYCPVACGEDSTLIFTPLLSIVWIPGRGEISREMVRPAEGLPQLDADEGLFEHWHRVGLQPADELDLVGAGVELVEPLHFHVERVGDPVPVEVAQDADVLAGRERVRHPFRGDQRQTEDLVRLADDQALLPEIAPEAVLQQRD